MSAGVGSSAFFSRLTRAVGVNKKQMLFNNNKGVGRNHTRTRRSNAADMGARAHLGRRIYLQAHTSTCLHARTLRVCTHLRPGVDFLPLAESASGGG